MGSHDIFLGVVKGDASLISDAHLEEAVREIRGIEAYTNRYGEYAEDASGASLNQALKRSKDREAFIRWTHIAVVLGDEIAMADKRILANRQVPPPHYAGSSLWARVRYIEEMGVCDGDALTDLGYFDRREAEYRTWTQSELGLEEIQYGHAWWHISYLIDECRECKAFIEERLRQKMEN